MMNDIGLRFVFTAPNLASAKVVSIERHFMSLDRKVGLGSDSITSAFDLLESSWG